MKEHEDPRKVRVLADKLSSLRHWTLETVSCFDTQSTPSRKVKSEEDKQRFEKDGSLVNER